MAKTKQGAQKFSVKPAPSAAELAGEFVVPAEQQSALRELDKAGAEIQKALGANRMDFLQREAAILQRFGENRNAYEKTVREIAKGGGLDFDKVTEPWNFDFDTMTFRKRGKPQPPPQVEPPVAPAPSPTNGVTAKA